MNSSKHFFALIATIVLIPAAAASAAGSIDMDDPRRVVGRDHDVRIDAQLIQDTVSPGSSIGVTYQIQNLGTSPIAVADKAADATYDPDTRTITLALGAEVPADGRMPHLVTIAAGETKVFHAGATPTLNAASTRISGTSPRFVQVKVSILRDLTPFVALMNASAQSRGGALLSDAQFDQWFESNDTIFLNTVPVYFSTTGKNGGADRRMPDASSRY